MQFDNPNIQDLVSQYMDFSVEGFNIFAVGKDHLPHLICVCPNKTFARAIQSLLTIAKLSHDLPKANAEITSNCVLSPMILADGTLALVAALINDAVWKNGNEVDYDELELQLGTRPYRDFVTQFISAPQETHPSSAPETVLHMYEDTLIHQDPPKDEFPFGGGKPLTRALIAGSGLFISLTERSSICQFGVKYAVSPCAIL